MFVFEPLITFTVDTEPIAQPRQRHRIMKLRTGADVVANYTPRTAKVQTFKKAIQQAAASTYKGPLIQGPIAIEAVFVFRRPLSIPKRLGTGRLWHDIKPDHENVMKAVQDALTGIIYQDDAQIACASTTKYRAAVGEQPSIAIAIRLLSDT